MHRRIKGEDIRLKIVLGNGTRPKENGNLIPKYFRIVLSVSFRKCSPRVGDEQKKTHFKRATAAFGKRRKCIALTSILNLNISNDFEFNIKIRRGYLINYTLIRSIMSMLMGFFKIKFRGREKKTP